MYAQGAKVAICARREEKLEEVKNEAIAAGGGDAILTVACDVTSRESVKNFVDTACKEFGVESLDAIVCVAGVMYFTQMKNCLMDQWDQTIDVNCKGVTNSWGAVLPQMTTAGKGKIISITSDAGVRDFPNLAVYCASKRFVETLTEITRRELVGTGVTLHTIQPGDVGGTELIMKNTDQEAADKMGVQIQKPVGEGFNRDQLLDPQDIADAVMTILTAPPHVAINSILIEAKAQE